MKKSSILVMLGLICTNISAQQLQKFEPLPNLQQLEPTIMIDPLTFDFQAFKSQYLQRNPEYLTIEEQIDPIVYSTYTPQQTIIYTSYQIPLISDQLRSIKITQSNIIDTGLNIETESKGAGVTSTDGTEVNTGSQSDMLKKEQKTRDTKGALDIMISTEGRILKSQQKRQMRSRKQNILGLIKNRINQIKQKN